MARRPKAVELWKAMSPAALRRLSLAVFLMFSVLGPLTILMESKLHLVSWRFVIVQTVACGGMAASIILVGRKRWWTILLTIFFWSAVLLSNGGGINFVYSEQEGFRVRFSDRSIGVADAGRIADRLVTAEELGAIFAQRGSIGLLAISLVAFGYMAFIRLMRSEVLQRARLEAEITIARDIQQALLPESLIASSWYQTAGVAVPATEVGGDFFDVVPLGDGRLVVAIADVTGHGVGSGILSAMTKSALRSQLQHATSPSVVLANLNATLYELTTEKMFVTLAYAVADNATRTFQLATAGHPPALLLRAGAAPEELRTHNLGLGMRAEALFTDLSRPFAGGDILLLYTDGILEAANAAGEQFGLERLKAAASGPTAQSVCNGVLDALGRFQGHTQFPDDVSLVCVRFS